jgi:DNA-binding GntR family transcriptional regulator
MRTGLTLGDGLDMHDMVLDALARGDGAAARSGIEADISNAAGILVLALVEGPKSAAAE